MEIHKYKLLNIVFPIVCIEECSKMKFQNPIKSQYPTYVSNYLQISINLFGKSIKLFANSHCFSKIYIFTIYNVTMLCYTKNMKNDNLGMRFIEKV